MEQPVLCRNSNKIYEAAYPARGTHCGGRQKMRAFWILNQKKKKNTLPPCGAFALRKAALSKSGRWMKGLSKSDGKCFSGISEPERLLIKHVVRAEICWTHFSTSCQNTYDFREIRRLAGMWSLAGNRMALCEAEWVRQNHAYVLAVNGQTVSTISCRRLSLLLPSLCKRHWRKIILRFLIFWWTRTVKTPVLVVRKGNPMAA